MDREKNNHTGDNEMRLSRQTVPADVKGQTSNSAGLPRDFVGRSGLGTPKIKAPAQITPDNSLDEILVSAREKKASDVHVSSDNPVYFKINGALIPQTEDKFKDEHVRGLIMPIIGQKQLESFDGDGDMELIHVVEGFGRFRVTLLKKNRGWDLSVRLIAMELFSFEESGMPESCRELTHWSQGLILVAGPAGCGKTTTLAVLCDMINQTRREHIITIESPVEIVFTQKKCQITQRELNVHTLSQYNALRAALREDPDILVVSDLRDLATIQLAVLAAETGHLVLGSMNTNDAAQTIIRIVNSFPPEDKNIVQNMIAESLRGIICMQLIPKEDGKGIVPAYEVLVVNAAVSNLIHKGSVEQILRVITTGQAEGMIPFDYSIIDLLKKGVISWDEAYKRSVNKRELRQYRKKPLKAELSSGIYGRDR